MNVSNSLRFACEIVLFFLPPIFLGSRDLHGKPSYQLAGYPISGISTSGASASSSDGQKKRRSLQHMAAGRQASLPHIPQYTPFFFVPPL